MNKDKEESREIQKRNNYEMGMCYKNAAMSLFEVPDTVYVEGYLILTELSNVPIDHGWLKKQDGTILDPTLPDDEGIYIEGKTWTREEVSAAVEKKPYVPFGMSVEERNQLMKTVLETAERSK